MPNTSRYPEHGNTYRRKGLLGWFGLRKHVNYRSAITCPGCGKRTMEQMPNNACVYFFTCLGCGRVTTPAKGKCCVFCSYGTVRCPPAQRGEY